MPQSTGEPPSSPQSPQEQKPEPPKIIIEKGGDAIAHNGFRTLTFPAQIHPRQKKFQGGADVGVVSKEVATAKYERDTFLNAGIKIEKSRGRGGAVSLPLEDNRGTVAAVGGEREKGEESLPRIPEEVFRKEDLKALWRRYAE